MPTRITEMTRQQLVTEQQELETALKAPEAKEILRKANRLSAVRSAIKIKDRK